MSWLHGIADRATCGLIATEGSSWHSSGLAAEVKKLLPDVLLGLNPAEGAEEDPLEPDETDV